MIPEVKIAPSILAADFAHLEQDVRAAVQGGADMIHIDIMDGHFVPNITFGHEMVSTIRRITDLPLDVHLMIEEPQKYIQEFVKAGSSYLTVHIESCDHVHRTVEEIKNEGVKAGIALNPATPLHLINELWTFIDMILIMSVNPGFGGQKFIPQILSKLKEAADVIQTDGHDIVLSVDGGINKKTAPLVIDNGAQELVIGSSIFKQESIEQAVREYKELCLTA